MAKISWHCPFKAGCSMHSTVDSWGKSESNTDFKVHWCVYTYFKQFGIWNCSFIFLKLLTNTYHQALWTSHFVPEMNKCWPFHCNVGCWMLNIYCTGLVSTHTLFSSCPGKSDTCPGLTVPCNLEVKTYRVDYSSGQQKKYKKFAHAKRLVAEA